MIERGHVSYRLFPQQAPLCFVQAGQSVRANLDAEDAVRTSNLPPPNPTDFTSESSPVCLSTLILTLGQQDVATVHMVLGANDLYDSALIPFLSEE